ncbi:hypothetical protein [Salinilacihabitans rarus]|uniref:hypothetical protein n=1 Tax=Salinilacihabitans rarus TaxID=2961596 RepID=UPI0020C897BB|nr:hypothetical protein [Salinilacihabitans rarus]
MSAAEWLFPNWSDPATIAALVGARFLLNATLAAMVARSAGHRSSPAAAAAGLTLFSTSVTVLVLRPGGPGLHASYVELLAQVALLALAGYAVRANPSPARALATAVAVVGAASLLLLSIPVYGEATVAP